MIAPPSFHFRPYLLPLMWIYSAVVWVRNLLYDWNILKGKEYDIPVIGVGNITVGGTGKTPHTEYIVRQLSERKQVAVLSRGYKRKSQGFVLGTTDSTSDEIGDEPLQIKRKFPHVMVAVDANRRRGIETLLELNPALDVIILDDSFQHRKVTPSLSILLVDITRPIYEDYLLPVGSLREPDSTRFKADIIMVTKCPKNIVPIDVRIITKNMNAFPHQQIYFTAVSYLPIQPLFPDSAAPIDLFTEMNAETSLIAVTGIARPGAFIEHLTIYTQKVKHLEFSDHHNFTTKDIELIEQEFNKSNTPEAMIVVTEKDGMRLLHHPAVTEIIKRHIYFLPMRIQLLFNQDDTFNTKLHYHVDNYKRDKQLSAR